MNSCWRARASRAAGLAALVLVLAGRAGAAQQPDSLRADSAAAAADSILDETERLLASEGRARERVPAIPFIGGEGPRPAGTRWVFTRDSLDWSGHETLGELLRRVPGLSLLRGGWVGRGEVPNYLAGGPGEVVYTIDGLPYEPLGPDSTQVDPGLIGLNSLERVEVLRTPGRLEVRLSTIRHDIAAPYSRIGIASGDRDFARYEGLLTQRASNGLGFGLGAEVLDNPNAGAAAEYQHTQAWVQASWLPSERHGIVAQVLTQSVQRDPVEADGAPIDLGRDGSRSDLFLRAFTTRGVPQASTRFDLLVARSAWSGDGPDQSQLYGGIEAAHRRESMSLGARAALRSGWTTLDLGARGGWDTGVLQFHGEGLLQRHREDRTSATMAGSVALPLPGGLLLRGEARVGSVVLVPAIDSLEAESITGLGGFLRFDRPWLRTEVGLQRLDGPPPLPPGTFGLIAAVGDSAPTTWLTADARLTPVNWLTLRGVVTAALSGDPEGTPPVHGQASLTVRSKFLRTFPSGLLDFKAEVAGEFWGEGILGNTSSGAPIPLLGNTLLWAELEIALGGFHAYIRRSNLLARDITWLPGLPYPDFTTTFGVRWDFLN